MISLLALGSMACSEGGPPAAVGTLERDRLDLVAEASEPVAQRPHQEGTYVEAGTLLVQLDSTRAGAQLSQAESARTRAAARLAELVRGPRQQRIREARAQLRGAEGRWNTTRNSHARARQLFSAGILSQDELDRQRAALDEALAARDTGRAALDELLAGTTDEELAQAEAALAEATAVATTAHVHLARLEVRAPTNGWIDALPYELGERPPAGGVVAVLLTDRAPYGRVYVPEAVRVHVTAGTAARVHVDGIDEPLPGRVRTVASQASFTPYFALTERDRGRLVYLAKVDLLGDAARDLPTGVPIEVEFETVHHQARDANGND